MEETFAIADYVYFIANGRIGAQGTPDELNRSSDPFVRQFLDASPDGPVPFHYPGADLLDDFAAQLDNAMRQHNVYYDDLIKGAILEPLKIRTLQSDAFVQYMRAIGKLGGQNKVPRLSNDRVLADALSNYLAPEL